LIFANTTQLAGSIATLVFFLLFKPSRVLCLLFHGDPGPIWDQYRDCRCGGNVGAVVRFRISRAGLRHGSFTIAGANILASSVLSPSKSRVMPQAFKGILHDKETTARSLTSKVRMKERLRIQEWRPPMPPLFLRF
jgi:hypothetical protein